MRVAGRSKTPRPMRGLFVSAIAGRTPARRLEICANRPKKGEDGVSIPMVRASNGS